MNIFEKKKDVKKNANVHLWPAISKDKTFSKPLDNVPKKVKATKKKAKVTCRLCALSWTPKVRYPKVCPRCKTYRWRVSK